MTPKTLKCNANENIVKFGYENSILSNKLEFWAQKSKIIVKQFAFLFSISFSHMNIQQTALQIDFHGDTMWANKQNLE